MQEIDDLYQRVLRLVLAGNIGKRHAGFVFGNDLRVGFAEAHRVAAGHALLLQAAQQHLANQAEQRDRNDPRNNEVQQRRILRRNRGFKRNARRFQPLNQTVVRERAGLVHAFLAIFILRDENDLLVVLLERDLRDLCAIDPIDHLQEFAVADLLHLPLQQRREQQRVQQENHNHCNRVIVNQRFLAGLIGLDHAFHSFHDVGSV